MNGEPGDRVAGVILAAGRSIRMGRAKAFLPVPGGGTFLERLVRTFELAGASPVVVVRPPQWADGPAPGSGNVEFAINPEPGRGQLSSLQCGLAAVSPDARYKVESSTCAAAILGLSRVASVNALMAPSGSRLDRKSVV